MKRPLLALVAALPAACAAPGGRPEVMPNFTLDLPSTCSLTANQSGVGCSFETAGGTQAIAITQSAAPFATSFPEAARARMQKDPRGFWSDVVKTWEAQSSASTPAAVEIRHAETRAFPPAPGAEACLRSTLDTIMAGKVASQIHGVSCALYDPASDQVERFTVQYMDYRDPATPPDPTLAADADHVFRSLRFSLGTASPAAPK